MRPRSASLFRFRLLRVTADSGRGVRRPAHLRRSLTFDLDAVDDPTRGAQQLTLFHAFYQQHQYLPLVITCAENDQIVMISQRHGTVEASLGADDDLEYVVTRGREAWPNVRIRVRGDAGFGNPTITGAEALSERAPSSGSIGGGSAGDRCACS